MVVKYLNVGEAAECKGCGARTRVPAEAERIEMDAEAYRARLERRPQPEESTLDLFPLTRKMERHETERRETARYESGSTRLAHLLSLPPLLCVVLAQISYSQNNWLLFGVTLLGLFGFSGVAIWILKERAKHHPSCRKERGTR